MINLGIIMINSFSDMIEMAKMVFREEWQWKNYVESTDNARGLENR